MIIKIRYLLLFWNVIKTIKGFNIWIWKVEKCHCKNVCYISKFICMHNYLSTKLFVKHNFKHLSNIKRLTVKCVQTSAWHRRWNSRFLPAYLCDAVFCWPALYVAWWSMKASLAELCPVANVTLSGPVEVWLVFKMLSYVSWERHDEPGRDSSLIKTLCVRCCHGGERKLGR